MELSTITQVTRQYGISTRTLRYYEQLGLIESIRLEDYAYRVYDQKNGARIGQIVLLRKLRIPIKDIGRLLQSDDVADAVNVFVGQVRELDAEIGTLDTLRSILKELIVRLNGQRGVKLRQRLLGDDDIRALVETIVGEAPKLKEGQAMNELNQANRELSKLRDVRVVYLPPATVAASHFIGDEPENVAQERLLSFAAKVDITKIKPDVRVYGFNHPNPKDETGAHGYEFWLTIPEELDVPEPLQKKRFEGGVYAAHMIKMGDFQEWDWLDAWVRENGEYEYRGNGSPENMFDALEEHLNVFTHLEKRDMNPADMQLDLLIPVRKKEG